MLTKIETQSRKKAKLTPYMDVMDFQLILLLGFVVPFVIWLFTGMGFAYTCFLVIGYIIWMMLFKVNKPAGYWNHYLSYNLRGKGWTAYSDSRPEEQYLQMRR